MGAYRHCRDAPVKPIWPGNNAIGAQAWQSSSVCPRTRLAMEFVLRRNVKFPQNGARP